MSRFKVDFAGFDERSLVTLKNEETIELFKKYKEGSLLAKDEIIKGNLRLVLSLTNKFRHKNMDLNDLFQAGCIGLVKAVDNFDLSFNVMFSTYAVPLVLGEIKRVVRQNASVHISRSTRDLAYNILKFKEEYIFEYGKEPTDREISDKLGIEEYEIDYALKSLDEPLSLFGSVYDGDEILLQDQIADKKELLRDKDALIALKEALLKIKENERTIITDRYMLGLTQNEVAEKFNVSQAQISRIEKNALKSLKKIMN